MLNYAQTDTKSEVTRPASDRTPVPEDLLPKTTTSRHVEELLDVLEQIGQEAKSLSERTAEQRRLEVMGMKREASRRAVVMKNPDQAQNSIDSWFGRFEGGPKSGFTTGTIEQMNDFVIGGMVGNEQLDLLITQVAREAVRESKELDSLKNYPEPLRSVIALRMGL